MINSQLKEAQASDRQLDFQNFNNLVRAVKELLATNYDADSFEVQNFGTSRNIRARNRNQFASEDYFWKCSIGSTPTTVHLRKPYWDRNNVWSETYEHPDAQGDTDIDIAGIYPGLGPGTAGAGSYCVLIRAEMLCPIGIFYDNRVDHDPPKGFEIKMDAVPYYDISSDAAPTSEDGYATSENYHDRYKFIAVASIYNNGSAEFITGFRPIQMGGIQDHLAMPDSNDLSPWHNETIEINKQGAYPNSVNRTIGLFGASNDAMVPYQSVRVPYLQRYDGGGPTTVNPSYLRYFAPDTNFTTALTGQSDADQSIEFQTFEGLYGAAKLQLRGWNTATPTDWATSDHFCIRHASTGAVMSYMLISDFMDSISSMVGSWAGTAFGSFTPGSAFDHHSLYGLVDYDDHDRDNAHYLQLGVLGDYTRNTASGSTPTMMGGSVNIQNDLLVEGDIEIYGSGSIGTDFEVTGSSIFRDIVEVENQVMAESFDCNVIGNGYYVGGTRVVGQQLPAFPDTVDLSVPAVVAGTQTLDTASLDATLKLMATETNTAISRIDDLIAIIRTHGLAATAP